VRFDDRLLTVLSQPVGDRHDAAVRWRQLVDLVARAGPDNGSTVVARALETIRTDAPQIDEELRATAARAVAGRPLPVGLLEYLVSDRLSVSAPVLAAATLDSAQWQPLLRLADEETRQFIEALHPEVGQVQPEPPAESLPAEAAAPAQEGARPPAPSLSDVVARIERRRRAREAHRSAAAAAAAPVEAPSVFRWECGPSGEIAWVDGAPRGALIGRSIARVQNGERVDDEVVRAFARRAPFRDAEMSVAGEGLVAGSWKISGLPAFDPTDGRFAGYRGIAQRDSTPPAPVRRDSTPDVLNDPDSLRELVHEIKTPLNAIIGFAEIIEGQFLGPADHRYRERAGEIVGQARLLLGAIDDLDFAAKIHSSTASARSVDLGALIESATEPLREAAARRSVELELAAAPADTIAAVEPEIAERLLARLATAVIGQARAGEHLRLAVERSESSCRVSISRPTGLRDLPDPFLFDGVSEGRGHSGTGFSAGFPLRLVRGLARIAGGDLTTSPAALILVFPRVT
jgi:hypothetical protein